MKPDNGVEQSTRERIENTIREMNEAGCRMTILGVAKEVGVSNATIHNRYPDLASQIRELAGKVATCNTVKYLSNRQGKNKTLDVQQKALRDELIRLKDKLNQARSVNSALDMEKQSLIAENEELKRQLLKVLKMKTRS